MFGAWRIGAISALVNVQFKDELTTTSPTTPLLWWSTPTTWDESCAARGGRSPVVRHLVCMDGPQDGALPCPSLWRPISGAAGRRRTRPRSRISPTLPARPASPRAPASVTSPRCARRAASPSGCGSRAGTSRSAPTALSSFLPARRQPAAAARAGGYGPRHGPLDRTYRLGRHRGHGEPTLFVANPTLLQEVLAESPARRAGARAAPVSAFRRRAGAADAQARLGATS